MKRALRVICSAGVVGVVGAVVGAASGDRLGAVPMVTPSGLGFVDRPALLAEGGSSCREGHHACLDIGHAGGCCANDHYCYIRKDGTPWCCPIGSDCVANSFCRSDRFYCKDGANGITSSDPTSCCPRRCSATSFLCPGSLGGGCCPYGATCATGGQCIRPRRTSELPEAVPGPTDSLAGPADSSSSPSSDGGLSGGAKAGIGVGVAVANAILIAAIAWLCVSARRHRRRTRETDEPGGAVDGRDISERTLTPRPRPGRGLTEDYFGPSPVSGPYTETAASVDARISPGPVRAVPPRPDAPGDIAAPVEMDPAPTAGRRSRDDDGSVVEQTSLQALSSPAETVEGRFELFGARDYSLVQEQHTPAPSSPPLPSPRTGQSCEAR
ncbi:hypothetical protein CDD83_8691 [Cordyceps sp. RAO-2017]|nr:hypothetical protein CDD83_8691 [Cordyceps sp. RAO-2017]